MFFLNLSELFEGLLWLELLVSWLCEKNNNKEKIVFFFNKDLF